MAKAALPSELVIDNLEAAAFLIDPVNSEHLSPFMTGKKASRKRPPSWASAKA